MRLRPLLPLLLLPFAACSLSSDRLPEKAPALADMDEPLDLRAEPDAGVESDDTPDDAPDTTPEATS